MTFDSKSISSLNLSLIKVVHFHVLRQKCCNTYPIICIFPQEIIKASSNEHSLTAKQIEKVGSVFVNSTALW